MDRAQVRIAPRCGGSELPGGGAQPTGSIVRPPWVCNHWSGAWSVWSRACSAVRAQPSARSSSGGGWCGRWTTSARSTSRAGGSCPTTSLIQLSPRDLAGFADIDDVAARRARRGGPRVRPRGGLPLHGARPRRPRRRRDRCGPGASASSPSCARRAAASAPGRSVLPSGQRIAARRPAGDGRPRCASARSRSTTRTSAAATPRSAPAAAPTSSSTSARPTARWSTARRIAGEQRLGDGDIFSFGSTYVRFEAS